MSKKKRKRNLYQAFIMDCDEVTLLSTKIVSKEKVSLIDHFRLWLHGVVCPPCAHFHSDNQAIQQIIETKDNSPQGLSDEFKEKMRRELNGTFE